MSASCTDITDFLIQANELFETLEKTQLPSNYYEQLKAFHELLTIFAEQLKREPTKAIALLKTKLGQLKQEFGPKSIAATLNELFLAIPEDSLVPVSNALPVHIKYYAAKINLIEAIKRAMQQSDPLVAREQLLAFEQARADLVNSLPDISLSIEDEGGVGPQLHARGQKPTPSPIAWFIHAGLVVALNTQNILEATRARFTDVSTQAKTANDVVEAIMTQTRLSLETKAEHIASKEDVLQLRKKLFSPIALTHEIIIHGGISKTISAADREFALVTLLQLSDKHLADLQDVGDAEQQKNAFIARTLAMQDHLENVCLTIRSEKHVLTPLDVAEIKQRLHALLMSDALFIRIGNKTTNEHLLQLYEFLYTPEMTQQRFLKAVTETRHIRAEKLNAFKSFLKRLIDYLQLEHFSGLPVKSIDWDSAVINAFEAQEELINQVVENRDLGKKLFEQLNAAEPSLSPEYVRSKLIISIRACRPAFLRLQFDRSIDISDFIIAEYLMRKRQALADIMTVAVQPGNVAIAQAKDLLAEKLTRESWRSALRIAVSVHPDSAFSAFTAGVVDWCTNPIKVSDEDLDLIRVTENAVQTLAENLPPALLERATHIIENASLNVDAQPAALLRQFVTQLPDDYIYTGFKATIAGWKTREDETQDFAAILANQISQRVDIANSVIASAEELITDFPEEKKQAILNFYLDPRLVPVSLIDTLSTLTAASSAAHHDTSIYVDEIYRRSRIGVFEIICLQKLDLLKQHLFASNTRQRAEVFVRRLKHQLWNCIQNIPDKEFTELLQEYEQNIQSIDEHSPLQGKHLLLVNAIVNKMLYRPSAVVAGATPNFKRVHLILFDSILPIELFKAENDSINQPNVNRSLSLLHSQYTTVVSAVFRQIAAVPIYKPIHKQFIDELLGNVLAKLNRKPTSEELFAAFENEVRQHVVSKQAQESLNSRPASPSESPVRASAAAAAAGASASDREREHKADSSARDTTRATVRTREDDQGIGILQTFCGLDLQNLRALLQQAFEQVVGIFSDAPDAEEIICRYVDDPLAQRQFATDLVVKSGDEPLETFINALIAKYGKYREMSQGGLFFPASQTYGPASKNHPAVQLSDAVLQDCFHAIPLAEFYNETGLERISEMFRANCQQALDRIPDEQAASVDDSAGAAPNHDEQSTAESKADDAIKAAIDVAFNRAIMKKLQEQFNVILARCEASILFPWFNPERKEEIMGYVLQVVNTLLKQDSVVAQPDDAAAAAAPVPKPDYAQRISGAGTFDEIITTLKELLEQNTDKTQQKTLTDLIISLELQSVYMALWSVKDTAENFTTVVQHELLWLIRKNPQVYEQVVNKFLFEHNILIATTKFEEPPAQASEPLYRQALLMLIQQRFSEAGEKAAAPKSSASDLCGNLFGHLRSPHSAARLTENCLIACEKALKESAFNELNHDLEGHLSHLEQELRQRGHQAHPVVGAIATIRSLLAMHKIDLLRESQKPKTVVVEEQQLRSCVVS